MFKSTQDLSTNRWGRLGCLLFVVLFLGGCAAQAHRAEMETFSEAWVAGDFRSAALGDKQPEDITEREIQRMDLLQLLQTGEALRLAGEYELALSLYDRTEESFSRFDEQNVAAKGAGHLAAILVNESVRSYRGNLYEAILVNSYKGLIFLGLGQPDLARVEFNRADDRTRRAVEFFAAEIQAELEALQEEEEDPNAQAVSATISDDDTQSIVFEAVGNPSQWQVYPDFVNPFVTYLHGLFFLAQSSDDTERARQSFERVSGMTDSPFVQADLKLAEALASGSVDRNDLPPMVWVLLENGNGPELSEVRLDLPIWLYTQGRANRPTLASIALPKVKNGQPAMRNLNVFSQTEDGSEIVVGTEMLADMSRVVNTEFQHGFNGILTRALASAIVNLALQAELSNRAGLLGAIAATAYTASTTQADLRIWRALPAEWQTARFERPQSGMIRLASDLNQDLGYMELPDWPFTLVYVRQTGPMARPAIRIVDLTGENMAINPDQPLLLASNE